MSKYDTGSYHVVLFDRYGSKLDTLTGFSSLTVAESIGQMAVDEQHDVVSYVVTRILKNSLDFHASYHVKEDPHDESLHS